ncbi:hypothetical protein EVC45_36615 [Paraburkholderia sp. UYCP14C]|uniref:hypothetical protein n=1 Tax=Paraburkholderia sp. UYCP14C TaxID=2511130 RepID=UPI00101FD622|nr:hypothetical protein [Paraburkholderia sp. UYCP14C]RZF24869.1 hypothetical protein EVC45_36615 [Paraburkholderia sp. UYCP14C]
MVKLYTADGDFLTSRVLCAGDVILLASGGHWFEIIDDVSFTEAKRDPYDGEQEKVRLTANP